MFGRSPIRLVIKAHDIVLRTTSGLDARATEYAIKFRLYNLATPPCLLSRTAADDLFGSGYGRLDFPMLRLLIPFSFVQSLATILLERGLYFYTRDQLGFGDTANLALAFGFGATYALGAICSSAVTARRGERPALSAALAGLALLCLTLALMPRPTIVTACYVGIGFLIGLKWPIIESYVTAGVLPDRVLRVLGHFNVAWSAAIPLGLALTGVMIQRLSPTSFVLLAAVIYVLSLPVVRRLPWVPPRLEHDHPARPDAAKIACYRPLMRSARWIMFGGCCMAFLLAPLMPRLFADFGYGVGWSPALSSVMDLGRFGAFLFLGAWTAWRGRRLPLAVAAVGLPAGFLMVLFAPNTTTAILGQAVFGLCAGQGYFAALYHAMVLENASVQAGGHHESLIGLGFALGPAVGLLGVSASRATGDPTSGMLLAVAPFLVVCLAASLWPLRGPRPRGPAARITELSTGG